MPNRLLLRPLLASLATLALIAALAAAAAAQVLTRSEDTRPKVPERWAGAASTSATLSLGGSALFGNLETATTNGGLSLKRVVDGSREVLVEGSAFRMTLNKAEIQDKWRGSFLYVWKRTPHLNLFAGATAAKNSVTRIKERDTLSLPGVCWHGLLKNDFDLFLVSLSPTLEGEEYENGATERATRATLRLNFEKSLSAKVKFGADATFTPDVSAFDDYRVYAEPYVDVALVPNRSSFRVAFAREYDAMPLAGVKKTDRGVTGAFTWKLDR